MAPLMWLHITVLETAWDWARSPVAFLCWGRFVLRAILWPGVSISVGAEHSWPLCRHRMMHLLLHFRKPAAQDHLLLYSKIKKSCSVTPRCFTICEKKSCLVFVVGVRIFLSPIISCPRSSRHWCHSSDHIELLFRAPAVRIVSQGADTARAGFLPSLMKNTYSSLTPRINLLACFGYRD
jgi:hypothetical protein